MAASIALLAIVVLASGGFAGSASAGPVSKLYLTQFGGNSGAIVQGNAIVDTFTTGVVTETGIAVRDSVRIINAFPSSGPGGEYDLNGNVISPGVSHNTTVHSLYDGTTDGIFNYSIGHNDLVIGYRNVLRFDLNWQNPIVLFEMAQRGSGITYDSTTNTLWTTGGPSVPSGDIQQYSLTGQLLASIPNQSGGFQYGIAWDPADDTLWTGRSGTNNLYQYSKAGALLQTTNLGGALFRNPFGMEFQLLAPVPEPGTISLLVLGLIGLSRYSRQGVP